MNIWIKLSIVFVSGITLLLQMDSTTSISFLSSIICIGILGSFIGTLAGGGGLITLPAMILLGIPIHFSIATNKFSSGIASLSNLLVLLKIKELNIKIIFPYIISSIIGGGFGAIITANLPEKWLNQLQFVYLYSHL